MSLSARKSARSSRTLQIFVTSLHLTTLLRFARFITSYQLAILIHYTKMCLGPQTVSLSQRMGPAALLRVHMWEDMISIIFSIFTVVHFLMDMAFNSWVT